MKKLFSIFLCLFNFFLVLGQKNFQVYQFSHITSNEGLPHSMVFSITQDKQGFIWFGTNNGLARYDGYNFRVFQPNPAKPHSISDKSAYLIYCDSKGNLWVYIQGKGLNKMNLRTEKFSYYFPKADDSLTISGNMVNYFFEDKDSSLWIATNKGINLYNEENDCFIPFLSDYSQETTVLGVGIINLYADTKNDLWFLSTKGIGRLDKTNNISISIGSVSSNPKFDKIQINAMMIDEKDNLWFCTQQNGLFCYNILTKKYTNYLSEITNFRNIYIDKNKNIYVYADRPHNRLYILKSKDNYEGEFLSYPMFDGPNVFTLLKFNEDDSENIWISSYQGLVCLNLEKGISNYRSNNYLTNTISGNDIIAQFIDKTDNLWLSIHRIGIDKSDLKQKKFNLYQTDPKAKGNSLAGNNVTTIFEDSKGNIWIGCYGKGLTKYNRQNKTYRTLWIDINDPSKLNFNAPANIYEDEKGYLWLGYYDGQLDKINPSTFEVEHYSSYYPLDSKNYFDGWAIRKILTDKEGNMWIASSNLGIIERDKETEEVIYHSYQYEQDYFSNSLYRTLHISYDDIVWAGTQNGGLLKYNKKNNQFTYYRNDPKNSNSISSNTVYYIYEESPEIMWIGTANGLNRFNRKEETFNRVTLKDGNTSCAVYCIFPDTFNNFWMSSDCGLIKFNQNDYSYENYYKSDGLLGNEFNTTSYCQLKSGEIFLGSAKGMISFIPGTIKKNPYKARPIITDFRLFNKSIAPGDTINGKIILEEQIWATKELILSHKENDFTLYFSALHYAAPEKIKYYYKLEGFNQDWIMTDSKRRWANFTGLPSDDYIFKLKATNNDGIMCDPEDEVLLKIIIEPPFWRTWWFRLLNFLVIIILALIYYRNRVQNLRNQKILLEKLVKERTKELEESNIILEEKQEEINIQKEELMSQKNYLEKSNQKLQEQHDQIVKQNKELDLHRNKLESLVELRTKELETAKIKAEESDRLKSSFLANMSHEIRTPMNAIIGFSMLLRDQKMSKEEREEAIDLIIKNSEALLVLINDILDISKIQAGQLTLKYTKVNLVNLLHEAYENFRLAAKEKNIMLKLVTEKIPADFTLETDQTRLFQVFSNLISNAIKFTNEGTVEFGVKEINKQIIFYVSDTGIGIPSGISNSIFKRFLKVEGDSE
ncbi:MAG: hypothetical protein JXB17_06440, partial [Bacteroidales bacterium]|nr:hypothetical protein [Bacteroidales bacterium]